MNTTFERTIGKDEWLTPPEVFRSLGTFDLDPCAPRQRPWDTATRHFTIEDDGLKQAWSGRVWLNPPYGDAAPSWLKKMTEHGNGVALTFARTETGMFFDSIWDKAHALRFLRGRLCFYEFACATCGRGRSKHPEPGCEPTRKQEKHAFIQAGNRVVEGEESAGAPSVLVAYGHENADALYRYKLDGNEGKFVALMIRLAPEVKSTWKQLVRWLMSQAGGTCTLEQIYELAQGHPKVAANQNWRAKIRQQVQEVAQRVGPATWQQSVLLT